VATAATVALQPLWDYPRLSFDELRRVEDVAFVHNQARHVLRVAVVEKMANGAVKVVTADGSEVRIEPGGKAFWRPGGPAQAEVPLVVMETWRQMLGVGRAVDAELAWLTSGILASHRTAPA